MSTISAHGSNPTLITAAGNNFVSVSGNAAKLNFALGTNTINVNADNSSVVAGGGGNIVTFEGSNSSIIANNSGNVVTFRGSNSSVLPGHYSTVNATGDKITVAAGYAPNISITGDNPNISASYDATINAKGNKPRISAGGGDHIINTNSDYVTIVAGDGNPTINTNNASNLYIKVGYGNPSISPFGSNSSIITGEGNLTLTPLDNASNLYINVGYGDPSISRFGSNSTVITGDGNATIDPNNASNVYIQVGYGEEQKIGRFGANSTLITSYTNDTITIDSDATRSLIDASDGSNYIVNRSDFSTIRTGTSYGEDTVINSGNNVFIDSGADSDYIRNTGDYVTISTGSGANSISNSGENLSIKADGYDDTLDAPSHWTEIQKDDFDYITVEGSDVIVNPEGNRLYLKNAADKFLVINGRPTLCNGRVNTKEDYTYYAGDSGSVVTCNEANGFRFVGNSLSAATVISSGDTCSAYHGCQSLVFYSYGDRTNLYVPSEYNKATGKVIYKSNNSDYGVTVKAVGDNAYLQLPITDAANRVEVIGYQNTVYNNFSSISSCIFRGDEADLFPGRTDCCCPVTVIGNNGNFVTPGELDLTGDCNSIGYGNACPQSLLPNAKININGSQNLFKSSNAGSHSFDDCPTVNIRGSGNYVCLPGYSRISVGGSTMGTTISPPGHSQITFASPSYDNRIDDPVEVTICGWNNTNSVYLPSPIKSFSRDGNTLSVVTGSGSTSVARTITTPDYDGTIFIVCKGEKYNDPATSDWY